MTVESINNAAPAVQLQWSETLVDSKMRQGIKLHDAKCIWLTGLSGAGKTTLANKLEWQLNQATKHTYLLDGDNLRHGLCNDLGMSPLDRRENIRRVGEVARLMVDAGLIVIAAFISPSQLDRDKLKQCFKPGDFIEVHVSTPLDVCEQRDAKGLYKKARNGEIENFTGISAPYDIPLNPDLSLDTNKIPMPECVDLILRYCGLDSKV